MTGKPNKNSAAAGGWPVWTFISGKVTNRFQRVSTQSKICYSDFSLFSPYSRLSNESLFF